MSINIWSMDQGSTFSANLLVVEVNTVAFFLRNLTNQHQQANDSLLQINRHCFQQRIFFGLLFPPELQNFCRSLATVRPSDQLFFVICCDRQVCQHKNLTYSSIMQVTVTYGCKRDIKSTVLNPFSNYLF